MQTDPLSPARPHLIHEIAELRQTVSRLKRAGRKIGLVPTMGALHEGHLSLVRAAAAECDAVIVTIFVNPTQFGPHEDFDKYPRTLDADLAALRPLGTDFVFVPAADVLYPAGFSTFVEPPAVAAPLEGAHRPGHFRGVATIVLKLFNLAQADFAYFGQKDYQQALVVRHMVADLNVPIEIRVCPIVREAEGLAMSSRNRYLDAEQRQRASGISRALDAAKEMVASGRRDAGTIVAAMRQELEKSGLAEIEYAVLVDPESLHPVDRVDAEAVALIAARVGQTRLIDNCRISVAE